MKVVLIISPDREVDVALADTEGQLDRLKVRYADRLIKAFDCTEMTINEVRAFLVSLNYHQDSIDKVITRMTDFIRKQLKPKEYLLTPGTGKTEGL